MPGDLVNALENIQNLVSVDSRRGLFTRVPPSALNPSSLTVTIAPVPFGVNGGNYEHSIAITDLVGTVLEVVTIVGGSAVSGAMQGTLIFRSVTGTYAPGTYQLRSATSGIQEAIYSLPTAGFGGGWVIVPQGFWNIYASIIIRANAVRLSGAGVTATRLNWLGNKDVDCIIFDGSSTSGYGGSNTLENLRIEGQSNANVGYAVRIDNQNKFLAYRLSIVSFANGLKIVAPSSDWENTFRDIDIVMTGPGGIGVFCDNVSGATFSNVDIGGDGTNASTGFLIKFTGGIVMEACSTLYCGVGLAIVPDSGQIANWMWFTDCYFDTSVIDNIFINPAAGGIVAGVHFVNSWSSNCQNGSGVLIGNAGTVDGVQFVSHRALLNSEYGYRVFGGKNISFIDCVACGNSWTTPGSVSGLQFDGASRFKVIGGVYSSGYRLNDNNQRYGIIIGGPCVDYLITGVFVRPNVDGGILDLGGTNGIIKDCIGYNPVGVLSITPTGSPFTFKNGSTACTLYIFGGTVTTVAINGVAVATSSPCQISLAPNMSVVITYSAVPVLTQVIE